MVALSPPEYLVPLTKGKGTLPLRIGQVVMGEMGEVNLRLKVLDGLLEEYLAETDEHISPWGVFVEIVDGDAKPRYVVEPNKDGIRFTEFTIGFEWCREHRPEFLKKYMKRMMKGTLPKRPVIQDVAAKIASTLAAAGVSAALAGESLSEAFQSIIYPPITYT